MNTDELSINLTDPLWRLSHLYACREEGTGRARPFVPRPEQEVIFRHLEESPTVPAYIIKSRRLGLSTGLCTYQADKAAFSQGWRGVLIDQSQADATKKMEEIVRFSVDSLPPEILGQLEIVKRNDTQLRIRLRGESEAQDSVIFATTSGRGGDCNMLHVSEWGPIQATDASRSAEIRSGSFPAARRGRRVVETTWMGGKAGDLWELIEPLLKGDPNAEGVIYFFPWHTDPEAIRTEGMVTAEIEDYFHDLARRLGKGFTEEQKRWWAAKKQEQGLFMSREYPSTLEEAFRAPIEGAVYAKFVDAARSEGRVRRISHDPAHLVWTFWDLGSPKNTRVIYVQFIGNEVHVLAHDDGMVEMRPAQRVAHMTAKGYSYGGHFMPHDAVATEKSGKNYKEQMEEAGLDSIRVIPRCRSEWPGVNKVADLLPRCVFNSPDTEKLLSSLSYYHTRKDTRDGHQTDVLVDDWSAHDADSMRMMAEAMLNGLLKGRHEIIRENRPAGQRQKIASSGRYRRSAE